MSENIFLFCKVLQAQKGWETADLKKCPVVTFATLLQYPIM